MKIRKRKALPCLPHSALLHPMAVTETSLKPTHHEHSGSARVWVTAKFVTLQGAKPQSLSQVEREAWAACTEILNESSWTSEKKILSFPNKVTEYLVYIIYQHYNTCNTIELCYS